MFDLSLELIEMAKNLLRPATLFLR